MDFPLLVSGLVASECEGCPYIGNIPIDMKGLRTEPAVPDSESNKDINMYTISPIYICSSKKSGACPNKKSESKVFK